MSGALSGLRVIEAGEGKALAYAGKLLRGLGAEVIKVEPPGGDALRAYGPFPGDDPNPEHSGIFMYMNGGKRGARLDLEGPQGREALASLLEDADALLHSFRPEEAQRLGLTPDDLLASHPRLIVTALTPFGWTGPYADWRGYAIQYSAGAGVAARNGDPERGPIPRPLDHAEIQYGGVQAASATVLALVHRNRIGRGQFVDIAAQDALIGGGFGTLTTPAPAQAMIAPRPGKWFGPSWGVYPTKDGHFGVITLLDRQWEKFLEIMGDPEWARDPVFRRVQGGVQTTLTPEQVAEWRGHLTEWFGARTNAEIWDLTKEARISFQPVHSPGQLVDSDQVAAREFMVEQPGPHPKLRVPGAPYRMSVTPWEAPGPPPAIDDPPATSWSGPRAPDPDPATLSAVSADQRLPLEGIRVIDLGQVLAGPLLGRSMADWGADVIMVDTATRPRLTTVLPDPDSIDTWETNFRNRRSVQLDLRTPGGVKLLKGLLATADVMIDNYTPRVMPNFGLPYEELAAEFPQLIMAALSAAGRDGPWVDLLSYGPSLHALFGVKSLNGYPPDDVMEDGADLDPISAGYAMLAIMAALNHRDRTGQGQMIEIAQGELALCGMAEATIEYVWNERDMGPQGALHRVLAPHGTYPVVGDDRWIAIACGSDEEWRALAQSAAHPEWLADERFATAGERRAHRPDLDAAIGAWTHDQDAEALTQQLQAAGVAAMPVRYMIELLCDPQRNKRREHFRTGERFPGDRVGTGVAWHLSVAAPLLRYPTPAPGEHSDEVFGDILGLSPEEITRYREEGVIA